jgi:Ca2+:H+ antiporter
VSRTQQLVIAGVGVATAVAAVLNYSGAPGVARFVVSAVALAGLAWIVSFATEQVGEHFGPAVTGFLQSTLGNLPEFFIVIFALGKGEIVVAQNSILGSLFSNALLVLGLVIVVGAQAAPGGLMKFRARLPNDTATLLLVASFIIALTGLSLASKDLASRHVKGISSIAAVALLVVYAVWVVGYLRSDEPTPEKEAAASARPVMPLRVSVLLLGLAGVGAAFVSDWFVSAVDPAVKSLGISKAFAGLVIVAIAGNAVENVVGIVLARKGQNDLAISVVKNSVAQIAAFLFPALILVSLLFSTSLTFALAPVYIGAVFLTAIAVWQITGDGEARPFEGWALIAMYVVLGAFAWFE